MDRTSACPSWKAFRVGNSLGVVVGCPFWCAQVRNWEDTCEATVYSHEDSGIGDALALVNSKLAPDGALEQKRNGKVVSEHSGVDAAECSGRPDK